MAYSQGKNYSLSGKGAKGGKKGGWISGWDGQSTGWGAAGSWDGKGKGKASSTSSGTVRRNLSGWEPSHPTKGASKLSATDH